MNRKRNSTIEDFFFFFFGGGGGNTGSTIISISAVSENHTGSEITYTLCRPQFHFVYYAVLGLGDQCRETFG